MQFVETLPGEPSSEYTRWDESLAYNLQLKPGVWALVKSHCASRAAAQAQAYMVRSGRKRHLPPELFEAEARYTDEEGWAVYVRAIPRGKRKK